MLCFIVLNPSLAELHHFPALGAYDTSVALVILIQNLYCISVSGVGGVITEMVNTFSSSVSWQDLGVYFPIVSEDTRVSRGCRVCRGAHRRHNLVQHNCNWTLISSIFGQIITETVLIAPN